MSAMSPREQREIARANQADGEPVVFVHGLWLLAGSWDHWRGLFEEGGYATLAPSWPDDPERTRVLASVDARYRGYFGSEQLKTFFDVGLWVPVRSRLAAGPLVGLGAAWDFSRTAGVYASASFSTAFGEARIASLGISAGAQFRFDLP